MLHLTILIRNEDLRTNIFWSYGLESIFKFLPNIQSRDAYSVKLN